MISRKFLDMISREAKVFYSKKINLKVLQSLFLELFYYLCEDGRFEKLICNKKMYKTKYLNSASNVVFSILRL